MDVGVERKSKGVVIQRRYVENQNQRGCWLANTAYNNENNKLEVQGAGESLCSSSLAKAHSDPKPQHGVFNGIKVKVGRGSICSSKERF